MSPQSTSKTTSTSKKDIPCHTVKPKQLKPHSSTKKSKIQRMQHETKSDAASSISKDLAYPIQLSWDNSSIPFTPPRRHTLESFSMSSAERQSTMDSGLSFMGTWIPANFPYWVDSSDFLVASAAGYDGQLIGQDHEDMLSMDEPMNQDVSLSMGSLSIGASGVDMA